MFVREEDFNYLENLIKGLDEAAAKRFLEILRKEAARRSGGDVGKIQVVGEDIFDRQGVGPEEFITKTLIRKAYREAKGGK